jgi:hypothetical protein
MPCQVQKCDEARVYNLLKRRSDQTDTVSVDLHQQRLNGMDACCPSAILAAACAGEKSKAAIQGS